MNVVDGNTATVNRPPRGKTTSQCQIQTMTDEDFMRKAISVAAENPRHPFGAIIADCGADRIIAEGVNQSSQHPMWHGEIVAINHAVASMADIDWSKLTLFTTAEPCPMCMSAILWCGIRSVVYGTSIPRLMDLGWNQINIRCIDVADHSHHPNTEVVAGVLEESCDQLFERGRSM